MTKRGGQRGPRGPQVHPSGELHTVDDEWKDRVRAALEKLDWSQRDLAARIGASPGAITGLLKPGRSQSRLVLKVHKVLGWPDPTGPVPAITRVDLHRRLMASLHRLSETDQEHILGIVESLIAKR